jgi:hypothetical protein
VVQHTIFLLAQQERRNNWATDKSLMGRAIPVLQALINVDPHKHYYFGQLAFALRDRIEPDWQGAKTHFDRAIDLLGESEAGSWPFYEFNRAICTIKLDAKFAVGKPSDTASRKAIPHDLRTAQHGLGDLRDLLEQPWNADVRKWLQLNGSPRLG